MPTRNTAYQYERRPVYRPNSNPNQLPGMPRRSPEQTGMTAKQKLSWLATIGICSMVAIFVLWQYALITKKNYEIQTLHNKIELAETKNASLQEEVIRLSSPNRIVEVAVNKLHMTFGNSNQGNDR